MSRWRYSPNAVIQPSEKGAHIFTSTSEDRNTLPLPWQYEKWSDPKCQYSLRPRDS